jgi:hypothetical protein
VWRGISGRCGGGSRSRRLVLAVALLAALLGGCSKKNAATGTNVTVTSAPLAGGVKASCDKVSRFSSCEEYTEAAYFLGESFIKQGCEVNGAFRTGVACPTANLLGSCILPSKPNGEGFPGETRKYYATGALPFTEATAKKDCDGTKGRWVAK